MNNYRPRNEFTEITESPGHFTPVRIMDDNSRAIEQIQPIDIDSINSDDNSDQDSEEE